MKLDREGAIHFIGVLISCIGMRGESIRDDQVAFAKKVYSLDSIDLVDVLKVFRLREETVANIISFSQQLGKDILDAEVICRFFGGSHHIAYALEDVANNGFSGLAADIFFLFHVLLPIELKKVADGWRGFYRNGEIDFPVKNIHIPEWLGKLKDGQKVFFHYGYVTALATPELEKAVLAEQSSSIAFTSRCKGVPYLDTGKMLELLSYLKSLKRP